MSHLRTVVAAALLLVASGCMSLEHLLSPDQPLEMYGGTTRSVDYISGEQGSIFGALARMIDLPLTVVFDTLLLPASVPVELSRG